VKAHLLYADADFDLTAELAPHSDDLIRDLELDTMLAAMAAGDSFLLDISRRVLLTSLTDLSTVR